MWSLAWNLFFKLSDTEFKFYLQIFLNKILFRNRSQVQIQWKIQRNKILHTFFAIHSRKKPNNRENFLSKDSNKWHTILFMYFNQNERIFWQRRIKYVCGYLNEALFQFWRLRSGLLEFYKWIFEYLRYWKKSDWKQGFLIMI